MAEVYGSPKEAESTPKKISGYREFTSAEIDGLNTIKDLEKRVLSILKDFTEHFEMNMRWASIAKTDIEKGFMAFNRALARPNGE